MSLLLSRLQIDTAEICGILGVLFHFILSAGTKKWKSDFVTQFFFFLVIRGFFFFPLLASLFYPENLILQKNGLTLSLSSGDEINCFLIHFPPSW